MKVLQRVLQLAMLPKYKEDNLKKRKENIGVDSFALYTVHFVSSPSREHSFIRGVRSAMAFSVALLASSNG